MKRIADVLLLVWLLGAFAPHARAGDADDVTKLAREFVVDLVWIDYDKIAALGRPQDGDAFGKPPEELLRQIREVQGLPQMQDIRRQLADQAAQAITLNPPAFTPDNTCAIVTVAPVRAELRKLCESMAVYLTYEMTVLQDKAQKLPMPKVGEIRAQVLAPGSPQQQQIDQMTASFPWQRVRLQFEKTASGWRVNLRAFMSSIDPNPPGPP